jgi:DNA-binding XRE family transcriptional regulator
MSKRQDAANELKDAALDALIYLDGIGPQIRAVRKAYGITQALAAKDMGVSRAVLYFLETGARRPSVDMLSRIAEWAQAVGEG